MKQSDTKAKLANSLKKLMETKHISKITITDIITDCNVNRKTFYYHFEDVCELYRWIHERDAISYVRNVDLIDKHEEVILFAINYIDKNKKNLNSAYEAFNVDGMRRIFLDDATYIVRKLIDSMEKELDIDYEIDENFKGFVCDFYSESVLNLIINWVRKDKIYENEKLIEYLEIIFRCSIPEILKNGTKKTQ